MITRSVLLGIVAVALFVIAPYVGFHRSTSLASPRASAANKGVFDEIAEATEKASRRADEVSDNAREIRRDSREIVENFD